MDKYSEGTCPVCGGDLYLDDSKTELHCENCEYTTTVAAMEMCKLMCPDPEEEKQALIDGLEEVAKMLVHEDYYRYAEIVQKAASYIGGNY